MRLRTESLGIPVELQLDPADVDDFVFLYGEPRDAGPAEVEVRLEGEGGFFRSMFAKDGRPKRIRVSERGVVRADVRFSRWSGVPTVLPPMSTDSFLRSFVVTPGSVVILPDGRCTLIRGANYVGKTSLLIELAGRGCRVLSDHLCIIGTRTGEVHPERNPLISLRRQTLRRYEDRLDAVETRETVSEVTGRVVIARLRDLFGPGCCATTGARLDRIVVLEATGTPADPVLATYPRITAEQVRQWFPAGQDRLTVPADRDLGRLADDLLTRR